MKTSEPIVQIAKFKHTSGEFHNDLLKVLKQYEILSSVRYIKSIDIKLHNGFEIDITVTRLVV